MLNRVSERDGKETDTGETRHGTMGLNMGHYWLAFPHCFGEGYTVHWHQLLVAFHRGKWEINVSWNSIGTRWLCGTVFSLVPMDFNFDPGSWQLLGERNTLNRIRMRLAGYIDR